MLRWLVAENNQYIDTIMQCNIRAWNSFKHQNLFISTSKPSALTSWPLIRYYYLITCNTGSWTICWRSDYIIGSVDPVIRPNKSRELTLLTASAHITHGNVRMNPLYRPFSHCIDQAGLGVFTLKSGCKHYNPPPLTVMWMNFDSPNFPSFCSLSAIISFQTCSNKCILYVLSFHKCIKIKYKMVNMYGVFRD